jgi:hypothetical protein
MGNKGLATEKLLRRTLYLVPGYILGSNSIAGLLPDQWSSVPLSSIHFISEYAVHLHCSFNHAISIFIFDPHSLRPFITLLTHPCSSLHHSFSRYCYYCSLTTNSFVTFFCVESLLRTYVMTHSCRFYFLYCTIIFLLLSFKRGSNIVVIARDCISGRLYSRLMQKPS